MTIAAIQRTVEALPCPNSLKLPKEMLRLIKTVLPKKPFDGLSAWESRDWHAELVKVEKGTIEATSRWANLIIGWSGNQMLEGLYRLAGDTLIWDRPVMDVTPGNPAGNKLIHRTYPDTGNYRPAEDENAKHYIIEEQRGVDSDWCKDLLTVCIDNRIHFNVFLYGDMLSAVAACRPSASLTTFRLGDHPQPMRIKAQYEQRWSGRYELTDVDLWVMPYNDRTEGE